MKLACVLLLFAVAGPAMAQPELVISEEPDGARFVTADIPRFWEAMDRTRGGASLEQSLQVHYLDPGSPGLQDFLKARIGSAADLAAVVQARPGYYASIRESTSRVGEFEPAIREAFRKLEALYPDALFPDVYFLIGRMNSGGTTSYRGLLIGTEMYGLSDDAPEGELDEWLRSVLRPIDAIPHIVVHELIHYQQADTEGEPDLLDKCVREGMGDFLGELLSGGHVNTHVHEWAQPREKELWAQFQDRMHEPEHDGWLYGGQPEGWPADLGYFIGYRICQSFYEKAEDKAAAVRELLETVDGTALLEKSGYAP